MKIEFKDKQERRVFLFLFVFGILTLAVNIIKIFTTEPASQYILLTVEMIAGLALIFVPFIFTRLTGLLFPKIVRLYYWFFLWISVFLGTGLRLIIVIPFWDKILHLVSPILLVAVGYPLPALFGLRKKQAVQLTACFRLRSLIVLQLFFNGNSLKGIGFEIIGITSLSKTVDT